MNCTSRAMYILQAWLAESSLGATTLGLLAADAVCVRVAKLKAARRASQQRASDRLAAAASCGKSLAAQPQRSAASPRSGSRFAHLPLSSLATTQNGPCCLPLGEIFHRLPAAGATWKPTRIFRTGLLFLYFGKLYIHKAEERRLLSMPANCDLLIYARSSFHQTVKNSKILNQFQIQNIGF